MKQIDLLIYDLDGTLIDSVQDIAGAVNHMLTELKLAPRAVQEIRGFIGEGVRNLVERSLGENHLSKCDRGIELLKAYYDQHLLDHTQLYPGVFEVLEHFQKKEQIVVTNKPERFSLKILKGLGIQKFFSCVLGGDSVRTKKPSPEAVFYVLNRFGVPPERAVMVGDSLTDIETGKNAKVTTCAVTYGLGAPEVLRASDADFVINCLSDLTKLFC